MLMTFDAPDSNLACVRRERSNTPLQALTLLNDITFVECAQALGRRIVAEQPGSDQERLRYGFRLCVAREPNESELAVLQPLLEELSKRCRARPEEVARLVGARPAESLERTQMAAWTAFARMLLNLDEFVTRE
jgi:hypothetical protein